MVSRKQIPDRFHVKRSASIPRRIVLKDVKITAASDFLLISGNLHRIHLTRARKDVKLMPLNVLTGAKKVKILMTNLNYV